MIADIKLVDEVYSAAVLNKIAEQYDAPELVSMDPVICDEEGKHHQRKHSWQDMKEGWSVDTSKAVIPSYASPTLRAIDLEEFSQHNPGIKYTVERVYSSATVRAHNAIKALQLKLDEALQRFDKHVEFNDRCEVHVANLGLLNINELAIKEDCCTDLLQDALDAGWRIVSVNPQPNQRRPDYVLGRYNPDIRVDKGARR